MPKSKLIQAVKERRETLKISQETLADIAGIGLRTLKQFESGNGNPTIKTLQSIANVLGLELNLEVKIK